MAQVTSGRVVFSRTAQPAQYESARAEVELAFILGEGEDPGEAAAETLEVARRQVLAALGLPEHGRSPRQERRERFVGGM